MKLELSVFGIRRNINKQIRHKNLLVKAVKPSPSAESLVETSGILIRRQIVVLDQFPIRENNTFMTARHERVD